MRALPLLLLLAACADAGPEAEPFAPSADTEEGEDYTPLEVSGKADGLNLPDGPLRFEGACEPGERITIAAVGDVLLHGRLQKQGFADPKGMRGLWSGIEDLLGAADVTYANLEGPTARGVDKRGKDAADPGERFDDSVYSSYPAFNYHPRLVTDLLASGVDVVSTANNHSLDRRALGIDRTIDALEAADLPFTGTRRSDAPERRWHATTEVRGVRLAWLACTYATNGIADTQDQVLFCYEDEAELLRNVRELAASHDAVIVTPHWGLEYKAMPEAREVALAHRVLDAGALAVIGSHPHVLQPWERHVTPDGRETFAIYSLGNFVSGQTHLPRRSTLLLYLGLTRTSAGLRVNGARYVPLHVTRTADGRVEAQAIDRAGGLADSRALTVGMFHQWNVHAPGAPLRTEPQCDPDWTPPEAPHPHDGWIGGSCADAGSCGDADCFDNFAGGLCSQRCDRLCPDRAGRATTFCGDLGFDNGGLCVARCQRDGECREGYRCVEASRYGDPASTARVCAPGE